MSDEVYMLLYLVVSLIIWLVLEMTGEMSRARNDIVDGTAMQALIIILWGSFTGLCSMDSAICRTRMVNK